MIRALWQAHRPFILRVASGIAVFLVLMNVAVGYRSSGRDGIRKCENDLLEISEKLRARDGVHLQHQQNAEALEARVGEVLSRISLSAHAVIAPPAEGDPPSIDFPRRKTTEVWSAFTDRADRIHLGYPDLREVSFDENSDLTAEEWADRYALLEVLRRVLDAGVECQLDRFRSISPRPAELEPVKDDTELVVIRFPIELEIEAAYPELLAFVGAFQGDRRFLSIELEEVTPAAEGGDRVLAKLVAAGIDLAPPREESRKPSSGFRRPR